jgi:hypothetical protein
MLISRAHVDALRHMAENNVPNPTGPGVLDPNPLNHRLVVYENNRRTVYVFKRTYFGTTKDGQKEQGCGYLKSWSLVELPSFRYGLHLGKNGRTFVKREKVDAAGDRIPHPHPQYGSTEESMRGWSRPRETDEERIKKKGEAARLAEMTDAEAREEFETWHEKFYPARDQEVWIQLGLLPGGDRYELERSLPKDVWRRKAKIPQSVKLRQKWQDEPDSLPVRVSASVRFLSCADRRTARRLLASGMKTRANLSYDHQVWPISIDVFHLIEHQMSTNTRATRHVFSRRFSR